MIDASVILDAGPLRLAFKSLRKPIADRFLMNPNRHPQANNLLPNHIESHRSRSIIILLKPDKPREFDRIQAFTQVRIRGMCRNLDHRFASHATEPLDVQGDFRQDETSE